jgi:alkylation response protein AidB-like acyl-CoA dehydrogenase
MPIDFALTEEQRMLQDMLHSFMEKECSLDAVHKFEEEETFPDDIWQKMAELGLMGLPFPEEYGGTDGSVVDLTIVCEELSWGMDSLGHLYAMSVLFGGESILLFGTEEQKRALLPRIISGEIKVAGSFTEPNAGSDVANIKTMAVENDKGFLINGAKIFSTGAHISDYIYLCARTSKEGPAHKGLTTFLVDKKTPGITTNRLEAMAGMAIHTNEVVFEDVQVPGEAVLGELNKGFYQLMETFEVERIMTGAMGIGVARRAFEYALQYIKEREQFGQAIGKFQALSHRFADLATQIHAARLVVQHAAWLKSQGKSANRESAMAKLIGTEIAKKTTLEGIQSMGAYGWMKEYEMERFHREALGGTIFAGTSEIQRSIIAGSYGL